MGTGFSKISFPFRKLRVFSFLKDCAKMLKVFTVDAQHLVFLSGKSFFLWEDGGQGATEGKKNRLILQGRTAIMITSCHVRAWQGKGIKDK